MKEKTSIEEEIERIDKVISAADGRDAEALYRRGRLNWKLGRRGAAMSDYAAATELNPDSPAAAALAQARDIMAFFNKDLYNP